MPKTKNYQDLTIALCDIFDAVNHDKLALDKASTLVKTANAITSLQRAKLSSTKLTESKDIQFFED